MAVGGYATATHGTVSVGTATGTAVAANASRKYLLLVNDSDAVVYCKYGTAAVMNEGIRLSASGGNYETSYELGSLNTGIVSAISSADGKKLLYLEGTG